MNPKPLSPWTPFKGLLWLAEGTGFVYFILWDRHLELGLPCLSFDGLNWGIKGLVLFLGLWILEMVLAHAMSAGKGDFFLSRLLFTHLPWLGSFFLNRFVSIPFPEPQNDLSRKCQVLFGLMLATHLFLLARFLLIESHQNGWKISKIFAWVSLFLFVGCTLWTATVCDLSGDEPHYLLMADALLMDGNLDLAPHYQNRDYQSFYHRGVLEPQGLEHVIAGKRYSHHPLGPVLLILPGFALAGRMGASLTMALLAALALYLTLRVLEETGAKGWPLHALGVIGLFSSPLLLFSGLIYPEIPTACCVAFSLLMILRKRWGWFAGTLGLMLWMHNRNLLLVMPFLGLGIYEMIKSRIHGPKDWGPVLLGLGIPLVLQGLYFHSLYGVWTSLGAHNESFTSLFRWSHFWDGFLGLLMDQECGLWFHFPVFALVVTGGVLYWKSRKPLKELVLGVLLFYYLFMSFYENLGLTPATRYWVGVTPLLLVVLYAALEKMEKWDFWTGLAALSLGVGVLANWLLVAIPWMRYNKLNGENWILKIAGSLLHLPLSSWEPAFQAPVVEMKSYLLSFFWILTTIGLTVWFLMVKNKSK